MRQISEYSIPAFTLIGVLVAWEVASRVFRIPKFVMPAPSEIGGEAWEWRYRFIGHTWVTLYETLGGFALSIVVGVPLAVLIVYSPWCRRALYPLIVLMQAVPKIAIAPVLLLMIGYGEMPKMIVSFRSTDHQSSAIEVLFTGSKTAPRVRLVEISGLRLGSPPTVIANWVRQSFGSPVLGQRKLSLRPFAVTAVVCG